MDSLAGAFANAHRVRFARTGFFGWMLLALAFLAVSSSAAEEGAPRPSPPVYLLSPGDLIDLTVFGAPEFAASQRLNSDGVIQIPLLGGVRVSGFSIPEAQAHVAAALVDAELLLKPAVTIVVRDYAVRQVHVLGQVEKQGPVNFPPEKSELDLVEVISMAGGFTRIAKKKRVAVTRVGPDGNPSTQAVNVDGMIDGNTREILKRVFVRPGDVVNVHEIVI